MVTEQQIREALCEVGRRAWHRGWVAANDGNFSFRLQENRIVCTPTLISKGFMKPEDMVVVDMEGNQVAGRRGVTSEVRLHLTIYRERPDVYSVFHVHPPHTCAFAITQNRLPKGVLPEVEVNLGEVPLVPYATPGTWEFAEKILPWVRTHDAFLLTNHGAATAGRDPYDAYYRMETLDQYCRMLLLAAPLGECKRLDEGALRELLELKKAMGYRDWRPYSDLYNPEVLPTAGRSDLPERKSFRPHPGPLDDSPKLPGA